MKINYDFIGRVLLSYVVMATLMFVPTLFAYKAFNLSFDTLILLIFIFFFGFWKDVYDLFIGNYFKKKEVK